MGHAYRSQQSLESIHSRTARRDTEHKDNATAIECQEVTCRVILAVRSAILQGRYSSELIDIDCDRIPPVTKPFEEAEEIPGRKTESSQLFHPLNRGRYGGLNGSEIASLHSKLTVC